MSRIRRAAPSALLRFHLSSQYMERITRDRVNEWDKHVQCRQLIGQISNEAKGIEYTSAQCSTALAAIPIEPAPNRIAVRVRKCAWSSAFHPLVVLKLMWVQES